MIDIMLILNKIKKIQILSTGDSIVHRLDVATKVLITLIFTIIVASFGYMGAERLVYFACYLLFIIRLSGTPLSIYVLPICLSMPFVLGMGVSNYFLSPGGYVAVLGWQISLAMWTVWVLLLKTVLTVSVTTLLISTTCHFKLYRGLVYLRVPKVILLQFILVFNYLLVLLQEANNIVHAYRLRSWGKSIKFYDYPCILGQLLLNTHARASQIYAAMLCRGFRGEYNIPHKCSLNMGVLLINICLLLYWRI